LGKENAYSLLLLFFPSLCFLELTVPINYYHCQIIFALLCLLELVSFAHGLTLLDPVHVPLDACIAFDGL
jgi:hypothetical protein